MNAPTSDCCANRLLAALPRAELAQFNGALRTVSLKQGTVLHHPKEEMEHIYFPHSGMVSLLAVMKDGRAIETATVGREGMVVPMAALSPHKIHTRAVVQLPLIATQIPAVTFRKAVHTSSALRDVMMYANEALFTQVQITAACNALHSIEARLARWILQSSDRTADGPIPLTQELLSQMLGVTRSSVSDVAGKLQAVGLIRYSRGAIEIVNRKALKAVACECYDSIRECTSASFEVTDSQQLAC